MKRNKASYVIQTVDQALELMEQFQDGDGELGVLDLGRRLKLHPNKVFRLLATLQSRNYVEQNPATEGYRLGMKIHHLGRVFVKQMELLRQARPVQESLARMCRETCYLSIMKEFDILYLDAVESDLPVRVVSRMGSRYPLHCTGAGKIFAANLSEEELREYLQGRVLKKLTPNSLSDPGALAEHLRKTAALGYGMDNEEAQLGVTCIGAPVRDRTGAVVGAVSISGPSARLAPQRLQEELIPMAKEAAQVISLRLGCG